MREGNYLFASRARSQASKLLDLIRSPSCMWTLYARSLEADHQRTIPLVAQQQWLIGRSSSADISISWDRFISRQHVQLTLNSQEVSLECFPEVRNRILFQSKSVVRCKISSGDEFILGSTLFQVMQHVHIDQETIPSEEIHFPAEELKSHGDVNSEKRLELLSSLPELLGKSPRESNFISTIFELLSEGVPDAEGILLLQQSDQRFENSGVEIVNHFSRLNLPAPQISQRLWNRSIIQQQGAVLHLWGLEDSENSTSDSSHSPAEFTASPHYNWAFCVPVELPDGRKSGVYVYGQYDRTISEKQKQKQQQLKSLTADVKFTNLMMELTSAVVRGRQLERQRTLLHQFFPSEVYKALNNGESEKFLEPRECQLTILFCDLSDFTTRAEQQADDLFGFLKQVSGELECATAAILRQGGVIGDFHGDAVMGFWGWPFPGEQSEERASLAALEIQREFNNLQQLSQSENSIRIGISTGSGIAGKIGTRHQMKVTAFGSVVNRAERLQGIGKQLHSAITLDQTTVENLQTKQSRLHAKIKPLKKTIVKGLKEPLECFEMILL